MYINVRRLFIYLEHSIDKATQWAVFEPNNDTLWAKIAQTVKDFLEVQWLSGALLGATADQAFFVRCDRSTMTQNDLDNGRHDLPHRCRPDEAGRVRHLPHRPVDRGCHLVLAPADAVFVKGQPRGHET